MITKPRKLSFSDYEIIGISPAIKRAVDFYNDYPIKYKICDKCEMRSENKNHVHTEEECLLNKVMNS